MLGGVRDTLIDGAEILGLVVKYTVGALVLIGAAVALQRAEIALPAGARGAATGAALLLLIAMAEHRRRHGAAGSAKPEQDGPRASLPSIHEIDVPYPKQRCVACGFIIAKEREGDLAVLVATPDGLRYYHRSCIRRRDHA